jgi:hypothetical protein
MGRNDDSSGLTHYSTVELHRHTLILRDALTVIYDDSSAIRRVVSNAGIPSRNIKLEGKPKNVWTGIIQEVDKRNKFLDLVSAAFSEHPESDVLRSEKSYWQGYTK